MCRVSPILPTKLPQFLARQTRRAAAENRLLRRFEVEPGEVNGSGDAGGGAEGWRRVSIFEQWIGEMDVGQNGRPRGPQMLV